MHLIFNLIRFSSGSYDPMGGFDDIYKENATKMCKDKLQFKQIGQEINYNGILKSATATSGASRVFFLLPLVENATDTAITDVNFPRLPKHVEM